MLKISDLAVGQVLTRSSPPLTQTAFNEFGALLGTDAPIHVDPDYAARTPFRGTIAQGMLLLAPFESWLCELFGEAAWSCGGWFKAKLLHPAFVGDPVSLEMEIRSISTTGVEIDLRIRKGEKLLAVGEARLTSLPV